jgi:hypothetical protein
MQDAAFAKHAVNAAWRMVCAESTSLVTESLRLLRRLLELLSVAGWTTQVVGSAEAAAAITVTAADVGAQEKAHWLHQTYTSACFGGGKK